MKKNILLLIFLSLTLFISSQNLSKKQFVKDFDYLYNSIINSSITVDILCDDYGLSIKQEYSKLRGELENSPDFKTFTKVCQHLFHISGDMHNHFITSESLSSLLPYLPKSEQKATLERIDTTLFNKSDENYLKIYKQFRNDRSCADRIKTRYFVGDYIVLYKTEIDGIKIPYGSKIAKINGMKTEDFVKKMSSHYFLKKDKNSNTFYTDHLFLGLFNYQDSISIDFITSDDILIKCKVNRNSDIDYVSTFLTLSYVNNAFYLKKQNLLYLTYTFLDNTDLLISELEKFKKETIDKIVIDIRGNSGGSDLEWIKLMNYLSDSLTFTYSPYLLVKNDSVMTNQFKGASFSSCNNDMYLYFYNDIFEYLKPNPAGLNYKNDFYIVIDNKTFSSALAFSNTSNYNERIKLVGFECPYYGGFGATPLYFMLPNSKLLYRISATFDKKLYESEKKSLEFDITVEPSIKEEIEFKNNKIRRYRSKKYLIKNNIFLKSIIEENL